MPIKHAGTILACNVKLVTKLAIFIIILGLIASAILINIVGPLVDEIMALIAEIDIDANEFIKHPFAITKTQIIDVCIDHITSHDWRLLLVTAVFTYVLIRFFISIPLLPITKVLHEKMTTGYDIGLFNAFVSTGFQNLLLSLILTIVISVIDLSLTAGAIALAYVIISAKLYYLLPLTIIAYLCLMSVRNCLTCQWLPEICASNSKNIFRALKAALVPTGKRFVKNFLCMLALNTIALAIIASTAITTLMVIPLIAIPAYMVMHSALSLTLNFSYHEHKYFVDNGSTIYDPTKLF